MCPTLVNYSVVRKQTKKVTGNKIKQHGKTSSYSFSSKQKGLSGSLHGAEEIRVHAV